MSSLPGHGPALRAAVAVLLTAALAGTPLAAAEPAAGDAPYGTSSIAGKITVAAGGTSALNATVWAYHLSTATMYRSEPTGADGRFTIEGLPPGYFDLAIETSYGFFVGTQVLNVPAGGRAVANMSLMPATTDPAAPRDFAGGERTPSGIAQFIEKSNKKTLGWAVGGGVSAVALLFSGGSSGGGSSSESEPP